MVRAGGASLSAYLLQALLLSLVFMGYGGGLIGQLGAAARRADRDRQPTTAVLRSISRRP